MESIISYLKNNLQTIVICSNSVKEALLKYIYDNKLLLNIHFKTPSQVVHDLLGEYSSEVIVDLVSKDGYHPQIAETITTNLLLIDEQEYQHPKLNELANLKSKYQKYLQKNELYEYFYQNNSICLINPDFTNILFDKIYRCLFDLNKVKTFYLGADLKKDLTIYSFVSQKDEVEAFAEEVSKLLANNVKPENIKIHHLHENYQVLIKNIFRFYNIDCDFNVSRQLYEYELTKSVINELSQHLDEKFLDVVEEVLQVMRRSIPSDDEETINVYNKIVNNINKYNFYEGFVKDILPLLKYEFSRPIKIRSTKYTNVITMTNILEEYITNEDYVFILGLNQDVFPPIMKDEDYLLDKEKTLVKLKTSTEINHEIKRIALERIKNSENIYLSYANTSNEEELQKSSFIEEIKKYHHVTESSYQYLTNSSYSKRRHQLLLCKLLDQYYLYKESSDELFLLLKNHSKVLNYYRTYDNTFSGIDENVLSKFLNNNFSLSFTSINTFFNCQFRFMLERVLRLGKITNERPLMIGNFFHFVLEKLFIDEEFNLDEKYEQIVSEFQKEFEIEFNPKEKLFIKIYQKHLQIILPILQSQSSRSNFTVKSIEESFSISLDHELEVFLNGKIDKILTYEDENDSYAIVMDYKTGSNYFDYNKVIYGLDLQTLIYFYMLNKSSGKQYRFAGAYLQSVLPNQPLLNDSDNSYVSLLEKELRWNGYSIHNTRILSLIDNYVSQGSFVNGIRIKNDGTLYATSLKKVISELEFELLMKIVEQRIYDCIDEVVEGNFKINPKDDGKVNSCTFCPFKDICFRKAQDFERVKVGNSLEFLFEEGEEK